MAGTGSSREWLKYVFFGIALILILVPPVAAGSVTRGSTFTVSIAGKPATDYYVWFTGTSSMSGEPGDQPPVIVAGTENLEFDPDGGPYTIGSYRYSGGNGRTIIEDVAPSSSTVSNTRYYAQLTTDSDGYGIVEFQTSSATADRTFTIKAQNPSAPDEEVPVKLGLPPTRATTTTRTPTVPETTVIIPTATVPPASPTLTPPVTTLPAATGTPVAILTPTTTQTPPGSPSPGLPASVPVIVLALAAGIVLHRRIR